MEHFVTLFDAGFLPQGLALHESLQRHAKAFTLWVLCMDEHAFVKLTKLALPNLRLVPVAEVEREHPELLQVKPQRTRAEYCWTLTPFTPKIVFDRAPQATRVTYVDADVFMLADPALLLAEFTQSGKAVQITEHAYDPAYDQSALNGRYCVQFMTFVRHRSEPVQRWWQERCIEWCHARSEDGKFGDQKYLDDWCQRFPELVHVLGRRELLLAPWNARRFPYSDAVAWHFHGLRLLKNGRVLLHRGYAVPPVVDRYVYLPYLGVLRRVLVELGEQPIQAQTPNAFVEFCKSAVKALVAGADRWRARCRVVDMK